MNTEQLTKWLQRVDDRLQRVEARKPQEQVKCEDCKGLPKKIETLEVNLDYFVKEQRRWNKKMAEETTDMVNRAIKPPTIKKSKLAQLIDIFK